MATTGYIYDPQNGRCLARIIDGEKVTSADGAQIGTVSGRNVFDLQGNLVGHLGPNNRLEEADRPPEAFKKLLKGRNDKG